MSDLPRTSLQSNFSGLFYVRFSSSLYFAIYKLEIKFQFNSKLLGYSICKEFITLIYLMV
ncbi:hypothetical protein ACJIZ3_019957 [Penstemon smallii]|uniref:Ribosomal protein L32 n=1 Tax=Penstemon smallii TaxID=265156 RepID=A0ABD3T2Q5_9LAMI